MRAAGFRSGETLAMVRASMTNPPKSLLYIVTEDWYFWSHRLALARAARDAGWRITVATRVQAHRARIEAEGFRLIALPWRRGGGSRLAEPQAIWQIYRLMRRERPDLVHLIALKCIVYGGFAARLAGIRARVSTVAGLGYVFTSKTPKARLLRPLLRFALHVAMAGRGSLVTTQNPDDRRTLADGIVDARRMVLIRGSGVDTARFAPAPEPEGVPVVAMACRLVRDKGVAVVVEAARRLKAADIALRIRLAGALDPENRDAHTQDELREWVAAGLVEWDGPVEDVPALWRASHVAVYPSVYGEGIPKTLLEAASCGKPIVTTDMPGCRETVDDGVSGFLVPPDDPAAVADRLRRLVEDPALRRRMGLAGREKALREFADGHIVAETLAVYRRAYDMRSAQG
jgi:glycosyltransferase involved in cell wall biosynthesis